MDERKDTLPTPPDFVQAPLGGDPVVQRLAEVEAKCVAQGIVLQAIVALLPATTVQELKAAAMSVDDEGMQTANPDPQLRRIASHIRHLLQLL